MMVFTDGNANAVRRNLIGSIVRSGGMLSSIKRIALTASITLISLTTTAHADEASFLEGFQICMQEAPTMLDLWTSLEGSGWSEHPGMSEVERQHNKGDTNVFSLTGPPLDQPGCTIMDETVSTAFATKLLVTTLTANYPGRWAAGENAVMGTPVWRLLTDVGTLEFSIDEDLSGAGASIGFELRP